MALSRFPRRSTLLAAAVLGAVALGGGAAAPALAAPVVAAPVHGQRVLAAPFSFVLSSGNPNFAFARTGTVQTRQFDILNDGDNDIAIDPAPLAALAAPFSASDFGFTKTTVIPKNGHAGFKVTYTAPAAGTISTVPVTLVATDQTDKTTMNLKLTFAGESIPTDPAHFTATTSAGAASIDFGQVDIGATATATVVVRVDGAYPIIFDNSGLSVVDTAGAPVSTVAVVGSPFATGGTTITPGATATVRVAYTPTSAGPFGGRLIIAGTPVNGAADPSMINVSVPFAASAVVVPTAPPATPPATATPAPTTPGSTSTPGVTGTAARPGGTGGSGGTGGLAETGLPALAAGGLSALLAIGGFTAFFTTRRRARSSGRQNG